MVFVIGGVTFSEISALRFLSKQSDVSATVPPPPSLASSIVVSFSSSFTFRDLVFFSFLHFLRGCARPHAAILAGQKEICMREVVQSSSDVVIGSAGWRWSADYCGVNQAHQRWGTGQFASRHSA
jgi:hypothetical protein